MNDLITQIEAGIGFTGEVQASTLAHPEEWFFEALTWGRSDSGETVNPTTALTHGPVWQAVNILAGDVGQLPLHVYRKRGPNRERDDKHAADWLLTMEPNAYQTPAIWKETMMAWALLWGNGCSYIVRDNSGRPTAFIPLLPNRTRPILVEFGEDGSDARHQEWWIETDFGDGKRVPLPYEDVFHVRGLATDGFWGVSCVQVCKNVIGGGLAIRKHGNKTFKNNARPGGALTTPGPKPTPEVMAETRKQLEALHAGAENAGRWLMLYGGATFAPMSMNNVDAQWLESMDLDRELIAGIFILPPYKLGAMKNSATRANTETQGADYINNYLMRHLIKIREEGERKLLALGERRSRSVYLKWIVAAFLRGDLAARGAYYAQAKTGEWMTTNEIRELEDMNPIEGGDVLKNPAINPQQPEKTGDSPAKEKPDDDDDDERDKALAKRLVRSQVGAMLEAEALALKREAGPNGAKNFCRWAANYYENYPAAAAHFVELPCEVAIRAGFRAADWRNAIERHAVDCLQGVLAQADLVTKAGLHDAMAERAEVVRGMADKLTDSILGGK